MFSLNKRSSQKELLDAPGVPFKHIHQNMHELNTINTLLGGHGITLAGFKKFLPAQNIIVCEIGCGGGDNIDVIDKYCKKHHINCTFIGVDILDTCIQFAKKKFSSIECNWICSDYATVTFTQQPHIIFSSLFCHHFSDDDLVGMLAWMQRNATLGFFINDLHRNIIAYWSIMLLTSTFSRSHMVKHDAPLSVARGFKRKEWEILLDRANIMTAEVEWRWAFRHLIYFVK